MIVKIEGTCAFAGCDKPAEFIACGRQSYSEDIPCHPKPACYCRLHADLVADERNPEYTDECPNCGCVFGVN